MSNTPESPTRKSNILALDIGNVCVELGEKDCAQALGYHSLDEIVSLMPSVANYARAMERGHIHDAVFFRRLTEMLPRAWSEMEALNWWCGLIKQEMEGMREVVEKAVKRNLTPVFFSDISITHFEYTRGLLSFSDMIPDAVCSYEVGASKPSPSMFRAMERRFCDGGTPALYIDDKPENITAARERGWHAHVFEDAAELEKRIIKDF